MSPDMDFERPPPRHAGRRRRRALLRRSTHARSPAALTSCPTCGALLAPARLVDLPRPPASTNARRRADGGHARRRVSSRWRALAGPRASPAEPRWPTPHVRRHPQSASQRRRWAATQPDTRAASYYNQSEWWRAANGWCLKRGGDTCHVAPQGSRCHAAFCSDLAPVLLALGPEAEIRSVARDAPRRAGNAVPRRRRRPWRWTQANCWCASACCRRPPASCRYREGARGAMDFLLAAVAVALACEDGLVRTAARHRRHQLTRCCCRAPVLRQRGRRRDDRRLGKRVAQQGEPDAQHHHADEPLPPGGAGARAAVLHQMAADPDG